MCVCTVRTFGKRTKREFQNRREKRAHIDKIPFNSAFGEKTENEHWKFQHKLFLMFALTYQARDFRSCVCVFLRWLKFLRFNSLIHPSVSISDLFIYFIFNTHPLFSHYIFFSSSLFLSLTFDCDCDCDLVLCALFSLCSHTEYFYLNEFTILEILDGIIILFDIKQRRYPISRFQSFFSRSFLLHSFPFPFARFSLGLSFISGVPSFFNWHLRFAEWLIRAYESKCECGGL